MKFMPINFNDQNQQVSINMFVYCYIYFTSFVNKNLVLCLHLWQTEKPDIEHTRYLLDVSDVRNFLLLCTCRMYTFSVFFLHVSDVRNFLFFVRVKCTHFYFFLYMSDIRIFIFFRHLSDVSIFYIYLHVSNVRIFFFFSCTCQMYTIFYFYLHESSYVRILKKNLFAPFRCRHFSIPSRVK